MIYHGFRRIALAHSLLPSTPDHRSPLLPRPSLVVDANSGQDPDEGMELDADAATHDHLTIHT
jgi:hypothetical protein